MFRVGDKVRCVDDKHANDNYFRLYAHRAYRITYVEGGYYPDGHVRIKGNGVKEDSLFRPSRFEKVLPNPKSKS